MSSIKKNLIYNIMYQVMQIILPLITGPYISRALGSEAIGTYAYAASIGTYFILFSMLGITNHGNRSIALAQDHFSQEKIFNEIYTIQVFTSCLSTVCFGCFCVFSSIENKYVLYTQFLVVLSAVFDVNWLFWGLERFKITVFRNTIIKIFSTFCIFLFVKTKDDLIIYAIIMTLSTFLSQIILWITVKTEFKIKLCRFNDIRSHIKPILILFIPIIAYSIYKIMDKIMLGTMVSMKQVGYYENAEKFINLPVGFITAFGTVMMPRISSLLSYDNAEKIDEYNELSFKYFSIIIIAISFGLIGISNILAPVFYGKDFTYSGRLMTILSFSLVFITWSNIIRTQYLIPKKNDKPYVISTIAGAVVNIIINYTFIPVWGSAGAAVGTVCAEASVFIFQMFFIRKECRFIDYIKKTFRFFIYGIVMCIVLRLIGNNNVVCLSTLVIQVIIGVIMYIIMIMIDFLITKDPLVYGIIKKYCDRGDR